jgi:hypothetical protein
VPVADQLDHLESGTDFESLFLQKIKKQSHPDNYSYQGIYVAAPNGMLLAGSHEAIHDAKKVEKLLQQGLEKWEKLPATDRLLTKEAFAKAVAERGDASPDRKNYRRGQKQYPEDGLVLRLFCRDLPRSPDPKRSQSNRWNMDHVWFRKEEALAFVPAEPRQGSKHVVRRDLVERLARFHLVDACGGSERSYPKDAVEEANLTAEVVEVTDDRVSLRFQGATRTSQTGKFITDRSWKLPQSRGYDAKLFGRAVYHRKDQKFVSFELLAAGDRWGATSENGRANEGEACMRPAPMGVFLELAGNRPADRVPPVHLRHYGWK